MTTYDLYGIGQVAMRFLQKAAPQFKHIKFRAITRFPDKVKLLLPHDNIEVVHYVNHEHREGPVFISIADNEKKYIDRFISEHKQAPPRSLVAHSNLKQLNQLLPYMHLKNRPVFVITNPVEMICKHLRLETKNPHIYGLGLSADKDRIRAFLEEQGQQQGISLQSTDFQISGLHYIQTFPLLSGHDQLVAILKQTYPTVESLEQCYHQMHKDIEWKIQKEFKNGHPPVERITESLIHLINQLEREEPICVSGGIETEEDGSFVGGILNSKTYQFRLPHMDIDDKILLKKIIEKDKQLWMQNQLRVKTS
ncbi:hypothetical protein IC620_11740 [Hazenella sp. IB182357]|uniref:Uncharacterized protein n=1 Tax=Polycladospora coralii TaxID=2771432 RepID=A0A926NAN5_9BACL|nr:hypothetical protein [Polycladospora coralii]MBD1373027.1 hypothetical protein [Polycladospora coralii]MBS7529629.1 hypothetical protein [Polycladospora coralii]